MTGKQSPIPPTNMPDRSVDVDRPLTVSVETVRKLTGLGSTTIWGLIRSGRLQVVKLGHRTLVKFDSVERLVDSRSSRSGAL